MAELHGTQRLVASWVPVSLLPARTPSGLDRGKVGIVAARSNAFLR